MTITIELRPSERKAIKDLAYIERRNLKDQVAHLVRESLERRGLVPTVVPGIFTDVSEAQHAIIEQ